MRTCVATTWQALDSRGQIKKSDRATMRLHTLCKPHNKSDRVIMWLHTLCKPHNKSDRVIMWLHTLCKPHKNQMFHFQNLALKHKSQRVLAFVIIPEQT